MSFLFSFLQRDGRILVLLAGYVNGVLRKPELSGGEGLVVRVLDERTVLSDWGDDRTDPVYSLPALTASKVRAFGGFQLRICAASAM
jgi:hypothetical protein